VLSHLIALLETDETFRERLERAWIGRTFHVHYERPLLLLAALRADARRTGPSHPLFAAIATDEPDPGVATASALASAVAPERAWFYRAIAERHVQTNDTLRSVIWRWPAWLAGCDARARPVCLVDLGASAGLNLVAERLPAVWTDGEGVPLPVVTSIDARLRLGLDARPVSLEDPDSVDWLRACIWPGDRGRAARLEAALSAFAAARESGAGPTMETLDASRFADRLAEVSGRAPDAFVLAYQSYVRGYLAFEVRQRFHDAMHEWLASLPPGRALWVELEASKSDPGGSMTVHVSREPGTVICAELARTEHHPMVVVPNAEVVRELEETLRR
jgi:hypothetical protein